jgi:hypothetical protein
MQLIHESAILYLPTRPLSLEVDVEPVVIYLLAPQVNCYQDTCIVANQK